MKKAGVVLEGEIDGGERLLVTTDPEVAKRLGFFRVEEDEWRAWTQGRHPALLASGSQSRSFQAALQRVATASRSRL